MREDTEVHSGYYTEDPSVLQPGSVRDLMNMAEKPLGETPLDEALGEPRMRADARRSRAKLLAAATAAFAENGADAPLEDIARRAGVGIGTLYRHFPTRTDLQAAVFRSQVDAVCSTADDLIGTVTPEQAFAGSLHAISSYLITKRGLAKALLDSLGSDSQLISLCSVRMRDTLDRLLSQAQDAGAIRKDISAQDVLRMIHGVVVATEQSPADTDRLLGILLDGLRAPSLSRGQGSSASTLSAKSRQVIALQSFSPFFSRSFSPRAGGSRTRCSRRWWCGSRPGRCCGSAARDPRGRPGRRPGP